MQPSLFAICRKNLDLIIDCIMACWSRFLHKLLFFRSTIKCFKYLVDFSYRTLSYLDCNTIKARERKYLMDGCQSVFAELILFCIYCSGSILFPCWSWANLIILPRKISDKHSVQSTSSRKMRGREQHVFTLSIFVWKHDANQ